MKIDNHVHIGVDPLFYLQGWSPYALDLTRLFNEAGDSGVDVWVVFPFVSYMAFDTDGLRNNRLELPKEAAQIPYAFENGRLCEDIRRMEPEKRRRLWPFLMADPMRMPEAQVGEWRKLPAEHTVYGIKIQPTILQSPIRTLLSRGRCMLEYAEAHNLPFLIHSSIHPEDVWSQCRDILAVAEANPNLRFLLAHSCRFHHESLLRVAELPNTWFDCSAHIIHCQCAVNDMPSVAVAEERFPSDYRDPARVLRDLAEAFPEKLIWGTDAPFYSYEDASLQMRSSYRAEVEALNALSPPLLERVCHRNTLAWLGRSGPESAGDRVAG